MKGKQNTFDFLLSQTHDTKSLQNLVGQLSPCLRPDHLSGYLPVVLSQGMAISKNDEHKLLLGRFWLDTSWNLFYKEDSSLWNNLPREMVDSPILDTLKVQLDSVLAHV